MFMLHNMLQASRLEGNLMPPSTCQPYCDDADSTSCVQCQRISGNHHCHMHTGNAHAPLESRSVCPWYYVSTRDENRYPSEVFEARCSCTRCHGTTDHDSACDVIHHPVSVLYKKGRVNPKGHCEYEARKIQLAVGCTCARTPHI